MSLAPGAVQQFSAIGRMSDNSTSGISVTWSETGGTVTSSGAYTAGATAGTFRVIATQQGGTLADTASVTIAVPPPTVTLTAIEVSPASASLLTGATQQFSAVGRMSDNSTSSVSGDLVGDGWHGVWQRPVHRRHLARHLSHHRRRAGWHQGRHSSPSP